MSTTSFRMDDELSPQLDEIAQSLRRSKSWIIHEALQLYIERERKRQKMLLETEEALADLEAHRLLSGDEVMKWLETWGTAHETHLDFEKSQIFFSYLFPFFHNMINL